MSTMTRRIGRWGVCVGILLCACTAADDDGVGDTQGVDESTTMGAATLTTSTSAAETSGSSSVGETSSGDPSAASSSEDGSSDDGSSSDDGAGSSSSDSGEVVFDEEFVWIADFMRTNCVGCHTTNMNGNLLLPSPDISNEEVRVAIDGVVATTGLLLVEPGDRQASQTWLQITNEFGAQFPVEDTDRFGAWIDAGAAYYAR